MILQDRDVLDALESLMNAALDLTSDDGRIAASIRREHSPQAR